MIGKDFHMPEKVAQAVHDVAPSLPPPLVAGMALFGIPLADWVLIATLIYTVILILNNLETLYRKVKGWCSHGSKKE